MRHLPSPETVKQALQTHIWGECPALPGRQNDQRAGVLVPLLWADDLICVLTLRSSQLRKHAGEVCFPGGRAEPGDRGLVGTALREAREELGISGATVLGRLSSMPLYTSDYRLEPYVAEISSGVLEPNPAEVAEVIRVSIPEVLSASSIDAIPFDWLGQEVLSPVFMVGGWRMYGGTAHVFHELLEVLAPLFGRSVPELVSGRWQWRDLLESGSRPQ